MKERVTEGKLSVLHAMPGRVRFRLETGGKDIPDLDAIVDIPGVEEASCNKMTNSLLVTYDTAILSEKALLSRIGKMLSDIPLPPRTPGGEDPRPDVNLLSQWIYHSGSKTNAAVNGALGGLADLTSIIPTAFIVWALEEFIRNPVMPKWYDILRAAQSTLDRHSGRYE